MKYLILIGLITILLISSCNKEKGTVDDSLEDAIIRDLGSPLADGCGWVVDVATIIYKPKNLQPEYEIDELEIKIKYDILDSTYCGFTQFAFNEIFITEIHNK